MNNYCQGLWENYESQDFYCNTDSFCCGLPNIAFFYSTLTSFSLLFCLFLYICNVVQLKCSPQNGARTTEAPPSGCYPTIIRVSPLGLLYSLVGAKFCRAVALQELSLRPLYYGLIPKWIKCIISLNILPSILHNDNMKEVCLKYLQIY